MLPLSPPGTPRRGKVGWRGRAAHFRLAVQLAQGQLALAGWAPVFPGLPLLQLGSNISPPGRGIRSEVLSAIPSIGLMAVRSGDFRHYAESPPTPPEHSGALEQRESHHHQIVA